MSFEDLANVHPRGYAKRVQHHVDGGTVFAIRHVFLGHDHRYHTLVTVTTSHLVTRLHTPLDGNVDLDHLQHARLQIVALGNLALLFLEQAVELTALRFELLVQRLELLGQLIVDDANLGPLIATDAFQIVGSDDDRSFFMPLGPPLAFLPVIRRATRW